MSLLFSWYTVWLLAATFIFCALNSTRWVLKLKRSLLNKVGSEFGMTPSGDEITSGKTTADLRQTEIAKWLRPAVLRGVVLVTRSPVKLALKVESVASGADRMLGQKELELGDPEFDSVCWLDAKTDDLEQVREYLTPQRRAAIRYAALTFPSLYLKNNEFRLSKSFLFPFYGKTQFRRMLDCLQVLSNAFSDPPVPTDGMDRKLAKVQHRVSWAVSTRAAIFSALPLLPAPLYHSIAIAKVIDLVVVIGVFLAVLNLSGKMFSRVLLQGYYAFQAVLCIALPIWAHFAGHISTYEEHVNLGVCNVLLFLLFWSSRHHLRTVGVAKTQTRQVQKESLEL